MNATEHYAVAVALFESLHSIPPEDIEETVALAKKHAMQGMRADGAGIR